MLNKRYILSLLAFVVSLFSGIPCHAALEMEYYTYNGFEPIVTAFQRVALIFGHNEYATIFFIAIVLAILFGGLSMVIRAVGGKMSPAAWLVPIAMGFVIYAAMIIPKGTLYIYDPVKNRNQAVGGIPDGIIFVAGSLNKIERAFVEIVEAAGPPKGYQSQAGGLGFDMLYSLGTKGVTLLDKNMHGSLKQYVHDCVLFELNRPGTTLRINDFANNTDFRSLFSQAQNPSVFTVFYDDTGDHTMSCDAAWMSIEAGLADASFTTSINTRCAEAGFDPTNAAEMNQCREGLENIVNLFTGGSYDSATIHRQMLMGQTMNDVLLESSPSVAATVLASRNAGSSMLGSGMMANQWLPIIRAVVTAIAICLIPMMVIFIPTPLVWKALSVILGFFIWITSWGIIDAMIHSIGMDLGLKALYEVGQYQLGLTAITNFSTGGLKALAMFAAIRWSGLMLATVISGILIKFGGTALAHFAGQMTATASHAGADAGKAVNTPEGMSKEISALEAAPPVMANAHSFSYQQRTSARTAETMGKTIGGLSALDTFGGIDGAAEVYGAAAMGRTIKFGAAGEAMRNGEGGYNGAHDRALFSSKAGEIEKGNIQAMYGNDAQANADRKVAAEGALVGMAHEKGMSPAELQTTISTMDLRATTDFIEKYSDKRGISFREGANELGELAASQKFVGAESYRNARTVIEEDGFVFTRTSENLNEAAKFDMMYQMAHSIGLAKNKEDYLGIYRADKMHHGEETLTLTDAAGVKTLNQRMNDMGYATRFQVGDRIRFNFDEHGNVLSAYGSKGAGRDVKDLTSEMKGYHSQYLNFAESTTGHRSQYFDLSESTTGVRGDHGSKIVTHGENTYVGATMLAIGEKDKNGNVQEIPVFGTFQYNDQGKLVAGDFKYGQQGSGVSLRTYDSGLIQDGKPIMEQKITFTEHKLDKTGRFNLDSSKSVKTREYTKHGYKTIDYINPADDQVVFSKSEKGQDVADLNRYVNDQRKGWEVNSGTITGINQDLRFLSSNQQLFLASMGGLDWGANTVTRGLGLANGAKGISGGKVSTVPTTTSPGTPSWGPLPHENPNINQELLEHFNIK